MLRHNHDGSIGLRYSFKPGQTNWISASDNLVNWLPIGMAVTDTNGTFHFQDDQCAGKSRRFYRVDNQSEPPLSTMRDLQYGLFVCWSNSSFSGRTTDNDGDWADWPAPYTDPDQGGVTFFNPPGLETADVATLQKKATDKWADLAVSAGMSHLLLCVKHVEGFCLWNSAASPDFCITAKSRCGMLHSDLVKAVANSCAARGLHLGFYYCLADRHNKWNSAITNAPAIVKRHLTELLGGTYGPIAYLFLDVGYGGQDLRPDGTLKYYVNKNQRQDLLDFVHGVGLDPAASGLVRLCHFNTFIGFNDPDQTMPGDYSVLENGHPQPNSSKQAQFTLPIMSGRFRMRWFYSTPEEENRCMSSGDLRDYYDRALDLRNVLDLNVGPDRTGKIRDIDVQAINGLIQALSTEGSVQPNHFLINDDGSRINGAPNGTISYSTNGGWAFQKFRGLGDYSDDAHVTSTAGDSCQYQFTGTAVEFLTALSSHPGSVDIYIDDALQTAPQGLDLHLPVAPPGPVAFARAGLPLGTHTIKIVSRITGAEVAVDAFRVYSGTPQSLSVDASGYVWVVDSEHQVWCYGPWVSDAPACWVRMPGTAQDIGCSQSVWKVGTDLPFPGLYPNDYGIARWLGFDLEWFPMIYGGATRIDVASDETLWTVNSFGEAGRYLDTSDPWSWHSTSLHNMATDIGCQSGEGTAAWKIGPDASIEPWDIAGWDLPITGSGTRVDVASNGDVWVVNESGDLWKYHAEQWYWKGVSAVDVACGTNGQVWYISTDGTIQRVLDP
jgi:hypothetical protein